MPEDYRERLLPRWWVGVVVLGCVLMLAVAYGAALGTGVGIALGVVLGALALWLLWITSPTIAVGGGVLRAAGAAIPLTSVAAAAVADRAELAALRGPQGDARVFTVLRPWSASGGVVVDLDDADDPHPAWLLSSRHPDDLVAAIAATIATHARHLAPEDR